MNEIEYLRNLLNVLTEDDLSVPELKKEIKAEVNKTDDFEVLDKVYQVFTHGDIKTKIENALSNTLKGANAGSVESVTKDISKVIRNLSGSSHEKISFIDDLENNKAVDTGALLSDFSTFEEVFSSRFAVEFFREMANYGRGSNMKGPGEFALAIMSKDIALASKGDLKINSKLVEVKAATGASGAGGRLGETGSLSTSEIRGALEDGIRKFIKSPEAQEEAIDQFYGGRVSKGIALGVATLHKIFPDNPKAVETIIKDILTKSFGDSFAKAVAKSAKEDPTGREAEVTYIEENFKHYKNEGGFDLILGITFANGRTYTIKTAEDIGDLRRKGILGSASISLIPGKANEIYAQLNFNMTNKYFSNDAENNEPVSKQSKKSKDEIKTDRKAAELQQKQAEFNAGKSDQDIYGRSKKSSNRLKDREEGWFDNRF